MKIIVEVQGNTRPRGTRFYRITVPDGSKFTWQGANPTHQTQDCALRVYADAGKKDQIMAIPGVISWRREDITVEEFKPVSQGVGKYWEDLKDGPMFEEGTGPVPIDPQEMPQPGGRTTRTLGKTI